jgi:hypothetical protein
VPVLARRVPRAPLGTRPVAVLDSVGGHERTAPVLAGVDDEVRTTEPSGDLDDVGELPRRPVEVGRIQKEALGLTDTGVVEQLRLAGGRQGIGRYPVQVDHHRSAHEHSSTGRFGQLGPIASLRLGLVQGGVGTFERCQRRLPEFFDGQAC